MKFLRWLFGNFEWQPEKYKWYRYISYDGKDQLPYEEKKKIDKWTSAGEYTPSLPKPLSEISRAEVWELRPHAKINGKKYWAKFYLTDKDCVITTKKHKIMVPLNRCHFSYSYKQYRYKKIRRKGDPSIMTPSDYVEYHVWITVNNVSKGDFSRYTKQMGKDSKQKARK